MSWNQKHLDYFKQCFTQPPQQGPVGQPPASYLRILREGQKRVIQVPLGWDKKLSRNEIRGICQDSKVDVLDAYAAVMAWGGQNRGWFRFSSACDKLPALLEKLRNSKSSREDDFACAQQAAIGIKGLGISYYTKLLYFFRPKSDAYILDQWTTKSMALLAEGIVLLANEGGPDPQTTPTSYKAFCAKLDRLAEIRGWACGEQAEEAIFDKRNGMWRAYVKSKYAKSPSLKNTPPPPPESMDNLEDFKELLINSTMQAAENRVPLPPTGEVYYLKRLLAFNLTDRSHICWDYKIIEGGVRCLLRFRGAYVDNHCEPIWKAHERHLPNANINALGRNMREIYLDVQRNDEETAEEFAERVVLEMSRFCVFIYKLAKEAGCLHPNLIPCNLPPP